MDSLNEVFRPAFNAPMLPGEARLDFESTNADGGLFAPEASLKSLVFMSTNSNRAAIATGARKVDAPHRLTAASGLTGSGKTLALIGLGHDGDIKHHFEDGVLYLSIGAAAFLEHITSELNKIMRVTGATESASNIL